jgi:hypothetical protein
VAVVQVTMMEALEALAEQVFLLEEVHQVQILMLQQAAAAEFWL